MEKRETRSPESARIHPEAGQETRERQAGERSAESRREATQHHIREIQARMDGRLRHAEIARVAREHRLDAAGQAKLYSDAGRAQRYAAGAGEWRPQGEPPDWNNFSPREREAMDKIARHIQEEPLFQKEGWNQARQTETGRRFDRHFALQRLMDHCRQAHGTADPVNLREVRFAQDGQRPAILGEYRHDTGEILISEEYLDQMDDPDKAVDVVLHEYRHSLQDSVLEARENRQRGRFNFPETEMAIPDEPRVRALEENIRRGYVDPTRPGPDDLTPEQRMKVYLNQPQEADVAAYSANIRRKGGTL
ncbi:MAG: hypothetical protein C4524_11685 [Candidatus Zixiibacteriota bacterium]|nr:MAG: hypothetical protein C4524_11685 [candidate division Zixibacteria bacterium]